MMAPHLGLERRLTNALESTPARIPVLIGGCGSGRTTALHSLADQLGRERCQYVDVERAASTPERFHAAIVAYSPFSPPAGSPPADGSSSDKGPHTARDAFQQTLAFLTGAKAGDRPATFLLDEVLELRTFESFPGLRHVQHELLHALSTSNNRFVLTSRYAARAHRLFRDGTTPFEMIDLPPLTPNEVNAMLPSTGDSHSDDRAYLSRVIQALADGRACYVRALSEAAVGGNNGRTADPISALTALLTTEGTLSTWCQHRYDMRLQRARGFGALKAILEILAIEEPLTLTVIAQRLHRTPGSTKDYLSWLEDVDLIVSQQKRYRFVDPLLRRWVRLHCRPVPPGVDEVAREVQQYALSRLPSPEPALAMVTTATSERKRWGIVEID